MNPINLPILSFENIYQHLEFIDIANLASLSHRMQLLILSVKSCYKQGVECDIEIKKTRRVITLRKEGKKEFTWSLHSRRDYWAADATDLVDKRFGGRVWRVRPHESGYRMIGINDDDTLFWLHHLRALFNCRADNLIYEKGNDPPVSDRVLRTYQFDSLLIRDASSLTMGDVWVMGQSCASVQVYSMKCAYWELNILMKNWLDSDNQKLEYCKIQAYYTRNPIGQVIEEVPATRGCPKRADASRFYDNSVRYEDGRDIRRRDGKVATWIMNRGTFIFIVWQMTSPNL